MSQPAKSLPVPELPPPPTDDELAAAIEKSRYPDGTVCPEALAVALSVPMPHASSEKPYFRHDA